MFPSDSPFKQYKEPEDIRANQDRALGEALESVRESVAPRTTRSVPIRTLEEWAGELDYIASGMRDDTDALAVEAIADSIRSHLPG